MVKYRGLRGRWKVEMAWKVDMVLTVQMAWTAKMVDKVEIVY
jgi:hypothetical protein